MVANDPVERQDSADFIKNKLDDLQRQIDALTRQSKYPFSISHGGVPDFEVIPDPVDPNGGAKVRISNGNGQPIFETYYSTIYNGKSAHLLDLAGNAVWGLDELAGYGISHPGITYPTGVTFEGSLSPLTGGTEYTVVGGGYVFYHPVLWFKGYVQAAGSWTLRCRVVGPTGEVATSTVTPTQSNNQYYERMVALPQSAVCAQGYSAEVRITPAASTSSILLFPQQTVGTTLGLYNVRPDAH